MGTDSHPPCRHALHHRGHTISVVSVPIVAPPSGPLPTPSRLLSIPSPPPPSASPHRQHLQPHAVFSIVSTPISSTTIIPASPDRAPQPAPSWLTGPTQTWTQDAARGLLPPRGSPDLREHSPPRQPSLTCSSVFTVPSLTACLLSTLFPLSQSREKTQDREGCTTDRGCSIKMFE